jgi:hypothetical protein
MKTIEFRQHMTSSKLRENLNKQFGVNVNLEKYNREKLEDMRNKLRTRIFQHEGASKFNDLLKNETYQKDKAMLELLNTRIKEMLGEQMQKLRDRMDQLSEAKKGTRPPKTKISAKGSKPDFLDMDKDGDKKEPMKKAVSDKKASPKKGVNPFAKKDESVEEGFPTVADAKARAEKEKTTGKFDKKETSTGTQYTRKSSTFSDGGDDADTKKAKKAAKVKEGAKHPASCNCKECATMEGKKSKPDFLDMDKDGNKKEPMKKAVKDKGGNLKEASMKFKHNVKFVNESLAFLINEDEEGKAKAITAAGDMVNDFTSWMQRVGQYQTKSMIELADAIRADFGAQEAEAFKASVGPALAATLEVLTQQRESISNAVAVLAGGAAPEEPMGMDPMAGAMPPEPGMDAAGPDMMNPAGDEFAASDAAAGGAEAAGRAMRESKEQRRARKLAEAHSILSKLAK